MQVQGVLSASLAVIATGMLCAGIAQAADLPKVFDCTFSEGGAWAYEKGTFQPKAAEAFGFEVSEVDLEAQTARLKRGKLTAALKTVQAVGAAHFLEVTGEGFLNVTTIYERDLASGHFPAVHSRHIGVLGEAVVSQYRGTCRAKG